MTHILHTRTVHKTALLANTARGSTNKSKFKKILNKQKHASRIIYFKDMYTSATPLMQNFNVLNIYQLNIYQVLLFKNHNISKIFEKCFKITFNKYNTKASNKNFYKTFYKTKCAQFPISFRGPQLRKYRLLLLNTK